MGVLVRYASGLFWLKALSQSNYAQVFLVLLSRSLQKTLIIDIGGFTTAQLRHPQEFRTIS